MTTKRRHEGYLMIDQRNSEGITPELAAKLGLPVGASRGQFEAPTSTCSHCHRVVVLNPLRTRDRPYCPKCDHYVCDDCETVRVASGGVCKTMNQVLDEVQERGARTEAPSLILPT